MSAISHSSLPWQTKHDFDTEGLTTIISNVDGEIIDGMTHHTFDFVAHTLDLDDDSQSHSIAVANARYIVRACNAFPELLEALGDVCAILDNYNGHDGEALVYDHEAIGEEAARLHEKIVNAIAKARGQ